MVQTMLKLCGLEEYVARMILGQNDVDAFFQAYVANDYRSLIRLINDANTLVYKHCSMMMLMYTMLKQLYPDTDWQMFALDDRSYRGWVLYDGANIMNVGYGYRKDPITIDTVMSTGIQLCTPEEILQSTKYGRYHIPSEWRKDMVYIGAMDPGEFSRYMYRIYPKDVDPVSFTMDIQSWVQPNTNFPVLAKYLNNEKMANMVIVYIFLQKMYKVYKYVLGKYPLANCTY
jgi:hypothetical protein